MGGEDQRVVIVHTKRAGVLRRGEALRWWCAEGMPKKVDDRAVSVKVKEWVLTSVYMPVAVGGNEEEVDLAFEVLAGHAGWARGVEINVIGGDFNAHVGASGGSRGLCGKFGLRQSNWQGDKLLEWCRSNGMTHVGSYSQHPKRGTWFSSIHRRMSWMAFSCETGSASSMSGKSAPSGKLPYQITNRRS